MVVPEESLQCRQTDPLLDCRDAEGVPENMWGNFAADLRTVRDRAHDALQGPDAHPEFVMERKVSFEERLDSSRERNYPPLGSGAVGSTFAVDHEPVGLPVDGIFFE